MAYCKSGKGLIKVNGQPIENLEPVGLRDKVLEPIYILGYPRFENVDIRVRVRGGGYTAQVYAIRQSIAKAIVAYTQKCEYSPSFPAPQPAAPPLLPLPPTPASPRRWGCS